MKRSPFKRVGIVNQKQKKLKALRIKSVGGHFSAKHLRAIADIADEFGSETVHFSTRQGLEIHDVSVDRVDEACHRLAAAGLKLGAGGDRVRVIVACPGEDKCRYGAINTKLLAGALDQRWFKEPMPYKIKINVTGCPNNCAKAWENDIGVMGVTVPVWSSTLCTDCGACVRNCVVGAITRTADATYTIDSSTCINCSACSTLCPVDGAMLASKRAYRLIIGGTMGKRPRLGKIFLDQAESIDEILETIEGVLEAYRQLGLPKERLGYCIDRVGREIFREAVGLDA